MTGDEVLWLLALSPSSSSGQSSTLGGFQDTAVFSFGDAAGMRALQGGDDTAMAAAAIPAEAMLDKAGRQTRWGLETNTSVRRRAA